MSIPKIYSVREAIMHSLEYFNNGKLRRHRLKMSDPDVYYSLIENTNHQEDDTTPSKITFNDYLSTSSRIELV